MSRAARTPAIFLDRDGTLLTELGYLADPAALELLPRAGQAVARLNRMGLPVVLVTNQSGIARGLFDERTLERIHARLAEQLACAAAHLDLILVCPHHPGLGESPWRRACACRKPAPGLLLEAARKLPIDLSHSWLVGDGLRDLEAARRAGLAGAVLVRTGRGADTEAGLGAEQRARVRLADDLYAAADVLERELGPQGK
jgi:D-glycero-D-manno-heptose 1,7-bisphosphate phosphatase